MGDMLAKARNIYSDGSMWRKAIIIILMIVLVVVLFVVIVLFPERNILLSEPNKFDHDGITRTYRIHTPKTVDSKTKIVLALHGFSSNSQQMAYLSGLHNVDDSSIVIYPDALRAQSPYKRGWNADFCCGSGWMNKTDDSGFLAALTRGIAKQYNVDKVFVTGFSNGGFMAQKLAIEHHDLFDGVAVVSSAIGTTSARLEPSQPTPILLLHGAKDDVLPLRGGSQNGDPEFEWLSFSDMVSAWQNTNSENNVTSRVLENGGHQWFDWRIVNIWHRNPATSSEVFDFYSSL